MCHALGPLTSAALATLKDTVTRNVLLLVRVLMMRKKFSDFSVVIMCRTAKNLSSLTCGKSSVVVGTVQHLSVP